MSADSHIKIRPHRVKGVMIDQTMLLPSESLVSAHIGRVPFGETRDMAAIRADMAIAEGAEATCPVTTQRMIKVVAAKAVAEHAAGREAVPFWRVVDPDTPNGKRLAGGAEFIRARREEEQS